MSLTDSPEVDSSFFFWGGGLAYGEGDSRVGVIFGEGGDPVRRTRVRMKSAAPDYDAAVISGCRGGVDRVCSHEDGKAPFKRRGIRVKSADPISDAVVTSGSRGGVAGGCQRGSKRVRSEAPITRDPRYNDGLHWPGQGAGVEVRAPKAVPMNAWENVM